MAGFGQYRAVTVSGPPGGGYYIRIALSREKGGEAISIVIPRERSGDKKKVDVFFSRCRSDRPSLFLSHSLVVAAATILCLLKKSMPSERERSATAAAGVASRDEFEE